MNEEWTNEQDIAQDNASEPTEEFKPCVEEGEPLDLQKLARIVHWVFIAIVIKSALLAIMLIISEFDNGMSSSDWGTYRLATIGAIVGDFVPYAVLSRLSLKYLREGRQNAVAMTKVYCRYFMIMEAVNTLITSAVSMSGGISLITIFGGAAHSAAIGAICLFASIVAGAIVFWGSISPLSTIDAASDADKEKYAKAKLPQEWAIAVAVLAIFQLLTNACWAYDMLELFG